MRRRVLDVIRSPKEFLRMPRLRPGTNPPRRMGNDTAGPRFLFVKRQPQRRCPVVFEAEGSLGSFRNDNLLANATDSLFFLSFLILSSYSPLFPTCISSRCSTRVPSLSTVALPLYPLFVLLSFCNGIPRWNAATSRYVIINNHQGRGTQR